MSEYKSSIGSLYGYPEKVRDDARTLGEILKRQGSRLLIDVIAEHAGKCAIQFEMSPEERDRLIKSLRTELVEALLERL